MPLFPKYIVTSMIRKRIFSNVCCPQNFHVFDTEKEMFVQVFQATLSLFQL